MQRRKVCRRGRRGRKFHGLLATKYSTGFLIFVGVSCMEVATSEIESSRLYVLLPADCEWIFSHGGSLSILLYGFNLNEVISVFENRSRHLQSQPFEFRAWLWQRGTPHF